MSRMYTIEYIYDRDGKLIKEIETEDSYPIRNIKYGYDLENRELLKYKTYSTGTTIEYNYDSDNNRIKYVKESSENNFRYYNFQYDDKNRLIKKFSGNDDIVYNYSYFGDNNNEHMTQYNKNKKVYEGFKLFNNNGDIIEHFIVHPYRNITKYKYDDENRLVYIQSINYKNEYDVAYVSKTYNKYNENGNIIFSEILIDNEISKTISYIYDDDNRLKYKIIIEIE